MAQIEQAQHQPKQDRAKATRQKILNATLHLLDEVTIDKISTNVIARHCGVNIATLYKYFPDKYAILHELASNFGRKQSDLICGYLKNESHDTPLETVCSRLVDAVVDGTRDDLALVQLQRSLIIFPELLDAYRETNRDIGNAMRPFLEAWGIILSDKELILSMICLGEAFSALQDLALSRNSNYDPGVIKELKLLLTSYYQVRSYAGAKTQSK